MSLLQRAREFHARQAAVSAAAVLAARRQVQQHLQDALGLARVVGNYQLASSTLAGRAMAAEAHRSPVTNPLAFTGTTTGGVSLLEPAQTLLDDLTARLEAEAGVLSLDMLARIDRFVASEVTEAGRATASVEIVAEPLWTNYVRVLNPPSCSRCAILAGRIYRDNEGFLRHPLCDCIHWPVESWEQAHDEGLVFSPTAAFDKGQIRGLSVADEKAIADGADIGQVVNAAQGMYTGSIFGRNKVKVTSASTTKRSAWRKANPDRPVRLRPESIYQLADGNKAEEIRLLKLYGYIPTDKDIPLEGGRSGSGPGGLSRRDAARSGGTGASASDGGGSSNPPTPPALPGSAPDGGDNGPLNAAADRVMAAAADAEPGATKHVRSVVHGHGQLERLGTRFKTRSAVIEKLTKFGTNSKAVVRQERRFNDALRYTAVIPDGSYWRSVRELERALGTNGYVVKQEPLQWAATGYKGINLKITAPDGSKFEVQLHTRASLDAAERTHLMYEEQRKLPIGSPRFDELAREMAQILDAVPFPPGSPAVG